MNILKYAAAAVVGLGIASPAMSEFPSGVVTIVVGYAAGGSNDLVGRHIADKLQQKWGQPVVVENRPGAGGVVAAVHVTGQAADGHTLMVGPVTITMVPAVQQDLEFGLLEDFTPVALLGRAPMILVSGASTEGETLEQFLAEAETRELTGAGTGSGAIDHFATTQLTGGTGKEFQLVNYQGGTPAMMDVMGGHVDFYFGSATQLLPQIREGTLRPLAVTGDTRSDALPDVPTFAEAGVPEVDVQQWWGIFAPAGLPEELVQRINQDINEALASESSREFFARDGAVPGDMSEAEFADFVREEMEKWVRVAADAGLVAE